jgi:DnaJ-class molecular chaperone
MMLRKRCAYCRGQGLVAGAGGSSALPETCPVCNQRRYNLVPGAASICGCCGGSGRVPAGNGVWRPCPDCNGIGYKW